MTGSEFENGLIDGIYEAAIVPESWPAVLRDTARVAGCREALLGTVLHDDVRLLADVAEGRGTIIDSEQAIHGYPKQKPTSRPFNPDDWNLEDMTPKRPEALDSSAKAKGT